YLQYIQMIQFGEVSSGLPYLEYNGSTTMNSIKIKQKSLQSLFPYNLGDQLKFTGYVSGDYISITDNPTTSQEYIFDINHMVPTTPTAGTHITDEDQIEWHWNTVADADGYKYNAVNDYTSATDNGTSTSYTQTGLACETNYTLYVWAYNSCGTSSSLELNEQTSDCPSSFICGTSTVTYDGVTYNTVQIGSQCWLKENLRTTKYNDNSSIPEVTDASTWTSTTSGAYCCYDNNPSNCDTYGALYNWYAVNTGKLCPSGWHVPSDAEWTTLTDYLSANSTYWCGSNSSYIAKSLASTTSWNSSTTTCAVGNDLSANNSTGFSALPGGYRYYSDGSFDGLGGCGYWWSSTEYDGSKAWNRNLGFIYAIVYRDNGSKRYGFSVRCLRD
ncbi:MAG: fibrobacter succinogenes major paralogous domain-containing protein, partial [Bacteroidales bacterium]